MLPRNGTGRRDWWCKKGFWECGWWNLRKAEIHSTKGKTHDDCQEHCPLPTLCTPLFEKVIKMWANSGPGSDPLLFLATDAIPAAYSNYCREGFGQAQQTHRLVRPDFKTVQIWKCRSKERGGVSGKSSIAIVQRGKTSANCWLGHVIRKRKTFKLHESLELLRNIWDADTRTHARTQNSVCA